MLPHIKLIIYSALLDQNVFPLFVSSRNVHRKIWSEILCWANTVSLRHKCLLRQKDHIYFNKTFIYWNSCHSKTIYWFSWNTKMYISEEFVHNSRHTRKVHSNQVLSSNEDDIKSTITVFYNVCVIFHMCHIQNWFQKLKCASKQDAELYFKTACYAAWCCKLEFVIILFQCIIVIINTLVYSTRFYCLLHFDTLLVIHLANNESEYCIFTKNSWLPSWKISCI